MDADFSHDPKDLPRLFEACNHEGADMAIGSRYISGVNVVNWPMSRVLISYFASVYVRIITGMKVRDVITMDGYKFVLEDGSWMGMRLSGTEPLVRLYVEAGSAKKLNTLLAEGKKLIGV